MFAPRVARSLPGAQSVDCDFAEIFLFEGSGEVRSPGSTLSHQAKEGRGEEIPDLATPCVWLSMLGSSSQA
ncbi:MAG: hypothetical protein AAFR58_13830 [Cyanobacteria bacterium J06627_28]